MGARSSRPTCRAVRMIEWSSRLKAIRMGSRQSADDPPPTPRRGDRPMTGDGRHLLLAICTVAVACVVTPVTAQGQSILKRVRDQAAKRVAEGRARIDSTVMKTTGN